MKTVTIGERRFHLPFSELIPFSEAQNADLGESIKDYGVLIPVVCWKEKKSPEEETVIDGAHRVIWAHEHGLTKVPICYESFANEQEARERCEELNDVRRHLLPEQLHARREVRLVRVAKARSEGKSTRAIAEAEGISQTQVVADLKAAGEQGCSPQVLGDKIVGKDGKSYTSPAPTQAASVGMSEKPLCTRCTRNVRVGMKPVKGCDMCRTMRPKKPPRAPSKNGKHESKPAPVDAFGAELPKHCRDAYCDPWIQEAIDYLGVMVEQFWKKRLADGMDKRKRYYPFINAKDFIDSCAQAGNTLEDALNHLKDKRPAGVCPMCAGARCTHCNMCGLVPRELYKELKAKAKEEAKA